MPVLVRSRLRRVNVRVSVLSQLTQKLLGLVGEAEAELSVELIGDDRMRRLNREYRRKDRTTDVLAFACREANGPPSLMLGDVVISLPTAIRQAASLDHSLDEELVRLLIHGVLHLIGYDHERGEREARRMRRREEMLWKALHPLPELVKT